MTKTLPDDLTDDELEGLEHHGCSSGTSTPSMVRDAIVRACTEIRRHRVIQIASMERVRGIVRSTLTEVIETQWWKVGKLPWMEPEIAEAIAARVASQLVSGTKQFGPVTTQLGPATALDPVTCPACSVPSVTFTREEEPCLHHTPPPPTAPNIYSEGLDLGGLSPIRCWMRWRENQSDLESGSEPRWSLTDHQITSAKRVWHRLRSVGHSAALRAKVVASTASDKARSPSVVVDL